MADATHVYQVYIKTTPEKLWDAMVSPELTGVYFGGRIESKWEPGASYRFEPTTVPGEMHYGTVLELDPPHRLVQTFEHPKVPGVEPSRVTWDIEPMGAMCRLTVTHELAADDAVTSQLANGSWPIVLSGLKTLLETGEALVPDFGALFGTPA
ncbi:MAG TPA: SRPBCC family protein [Dehalococcoidia bacterium]|jgi:uncharacterized protein YndB with AHSA1/START domain|nr:SRPBCC family protein [Dehalococcoidia bacterium]